MKHLLLTIVLLALFGCAEPAQDEGARPPSNSRPVLEPLASPLSVEHPDILRFAVFATDEDLDPITLGASPLPPHASFTDHGDGSGEFLFAPEPGQSTTATVTFTADDGITSPARQDVTIYGSASRAVSVGTAASDVIVVVVETEDGEPTPTQDPSSWKVDGLAPVDVGRWSYPYREGLSRDDYPITMRHHIYLDLGAPLASGDDLVISTPYGDVLLPFEDDQTPCESVKVNQVGYSSHGRIRYANLGVHLGDLGPRRLPEPIDYEVRDDATGSVVHSGQASYFGDDTGVDGASGEHVYRMDLSPVPSGGPYHIRVIGYGRSHSFGIGSAWSRELDYVHARGLYHQRCGIALQSPCTEFVRGACHTMVEVTDAEPPDFIHERGPSRPIRGGYHDAGDFDRRPNHTVIPAYMLNYFDAFPERFTDGQYDIPESANGIPDWLDEALWGVLLWEELQEADGGVRAGTEADAHPPYGTVNAETDDLVYRTYRRDGHATASGAGLFAHASRLVEPYDPSRAADLLAKAEAAWQWVEANHPPSANIGQRMYASLQLYLATGDPAHHAEFLAQVDALASASYPIDYQTWPSMSDLIDGAAISAYFFGYLITDLPTDPAAVQTLTDLLDHEADDILYELGRRPYPVGPRTYVGYGSAANQGRYADPVILMYRLTADPAYLDAASQLADYSMGLNPLGKSYTTGLGANPPVQPLHLDSYFTEMQGLGQVPGIVIFGPHEDTSSTGYQQIVWSRVYPAWDTLAEQRRYSEGWSLVRVQEFTTKMQAIDACHYAFLDF